MRRPVRAGFRVALVGAALPLAGALGAACAGEAAAPVTLDVRVSPTPAAVGPAQVHVALADSTGAAVEDAVVEVRALPPEGSGAAERVDTAARFRPGMWVVEELPFPAQGEWRLEVTARLPDGAVGRRTHPIRVVGGG